MEGSSELMMAAPGRSFSLLRRWLLRDSDVAPREGSGVDSWWEAVILKSGCLDMAAWMVMNCCKWGWCSSGYW